MEPTREELLARIEALIRVARLGQGYVITATKATNPASAQRAAQHVKEIEAVLNLSVPIEDTAYALLLRELNGFRHFFGLPAKEFVERVTHWLIDAADKNYPSEELATQVREKHDLSGVYDGDSKKIHRLVRLAYLRGVRRGAYCVWESKQKVYLREVPDAQAPGEASGG